MKRHEATMHAERARVQYNMADSVPRLRPAASNNERTRRNEKPGAQYLPAPLPLSATKERTILRAASCRRQKCRHAPRGNQPIDLRRLKSQSANREITPRTVRDSGTVRRASGGWARGNSGSGFKSASLLPD